LNISCKLPRWHIPRSIGVSFTLVDGSVFVATSVLRPCLANETLFLAFPVTDVYLKWNERFFENNVKAFKEGRSQRNPAGWRQHVGSLLIVLLSICVANVKAQDQNPLTINGGSVLAMAGAECVALAVDKRFGSGSQVSFLII